MRASSHVSTKPCLTSSQQLLLAGIVVPRLVVRIKVTSGRWQHVRFIYRSRTFMVLCKFHHVGSHIGSRPFPCASLQTGVLPPLAHGAFLLLVHGMYVRYHGDALVGLPRGVDGRPCFSVPIRVRFGVRTGQRDLPGAEQKL